MFLRLFPCPPWWLLLFVIAAAASGCMRARANILPSAPPLDVPAPPPRVVLPIEIEAEAPPPQPEPPSDEARRAPTPARPRPAVPADTPRAAEEPPRSAPAAPPATTTPPVTTTLQTTPAAEQGKVERAIRATMARAGSDLNRIDYRALDADARMQYDTAKRFIKQADDAIRMKNLPFAKNLADKAATLAAQLGGR